MNYMKMLLIFMILSSCNIFLAAQCPGSPPLAFTFESTESRCESNGTITLHITGGTPFTDPSGNPIYNNTIIAPTVMPIGGQADSVFAALAAGTYTVEVADANGCKVTHSITVPGTHMQLELTPTWSDATCDGQGGGIICGTPDEGRPWPPGYYEYQLFDASTNPPTPMGPIGQDSCFTDLAAGSYQIRAYDSCQNFQTRDVILGAKTYATSFNVSYTTRYVPCDSMCVFLSVPNYSTPWGEYPYNWEIIASTEPEILNETGVFDSPAERDTLCWSPIANGNFTIRVTDQCGNVATRILYFYGNRSGGTNGFDCVEGGFLNISSTFSSTFYCPDGSVTWEVTSAPTGAPIPPPQDTGYFPGLQSGTYCVKITDCCGFVSSTCRTVSVPAWTLCTGVSNRVICDNETIRWRPCRSSNGGPNPVGLVAIITSAPTGYTDPLPDTLPSSTSYVYGPPGQYCITMFDECNRRDSMCYELNPDTLVYDYDIEITPGCVTGNELTVNYTANFSSYFRVYAINPYASLGLMFNGDNLNNLSTGDYRFRYYNSSAGCYVLDDTITIPEYIPPAITGAWGIECTNGAGLITVAGADGNTPYTYELYQGPVTRPLQSSPSFAGLPAGTYDIRLNDNCNNSAQTSVSIEPFMPVVNGYGGSFCIGDSAAIYVDYLELATYSWTGPNGNMSDTSILTFPSITAADAGTYTVNIDVANPDQTACVAQTLTIDITVVDCSCTIAAFAASMVSCNGESDGSATANINSASGAPFTYTWSNGANTQMINNLGPGTYAVTITDAGGCTTTGDTTITEPLAITVIETVTDVLCNGDGSGMIMLLPSGGTTTGCAGYTYAWSNGASTQDLTGVSGGNYSVTITDCGGCTYTNSYMITEPTAVTITGTATNLTCNGAANGSISITPSGGTVSGCSYSYLWSNGATTQNLMAISGGNYTVTVTDCANCAATASFMVVEPAALTCNTASTNVNCANGADGTATATAMGGTMPYSYLWSTGAVTQGIVNLTAGMYTVTITDANNCTTVCSTMITAPTSGIVSIASNILNVLCYGDASGSATYQTSGGTPPYTIDWSNGQQDINIPNGGQAVNMNLTAGTYFLTITDMNGCTLQKSFTLTQNPDLIAAVSGVQNPLCNGGSDGTATYSPSGGIPPYYYNWSTGESTMTATGLSAGFNYTTVSDAVGCSKTYSVFLGEPRILQCFASATPATCNGDSDGTVSTIVSGGTLNPGSPDYMYLWNTGDTTPAISNLPAGIYTVTVTDDNGCTTTCSTTVKEPDELLISLSGTNLVCNGDNSGEIDMTVTGGNDCNIAAFGNQDTYLWSNGATTQDIFGLAAGTYTVTVTDCKGCVATSSITLTEPPVLTAIGVGTNLLCNADNTGSINLTVTGGTPGYFYLWNNGMTVEDPSGLAAGTYTVTVTDANRCVTTTSVTLTEPDVLTCSLSGTDVNCNGGADGTIQVNPVGGTTPYNYSWSNGSTTMSMTGLTAGTYTVTVTDANSCITTCDLMLSEPPLAVCTQIDTFKLGDIIDASTTGSIDETDPNFTKVYYLVDDMGVVVAMNNTGFFTNDVVALNCYRAYPVVYDTTNPPVPLPGVGNPLDTIGTTVMGCFNYDYCNYFCCFCVLEKLDCNVMIDNEVTCHGYMDGTATASATGGTAPYTFQWDAAASNQSSATATGLAAGTYVISVTDFRGCVETCSIEMTQPPKIEVTVAMTSVTCFSFSDGTASVTASGGVPTYVYQWDAAAGSQTTAMATGLSAGTYAVSVTDNNGCCYISSVVVGQESCMSCELAENGTIDICAILDANPMDPIGTLDCDNGGVLNIDECNSGNDPLDSSDDCDAAETGNLDICLLINGDPAHPLATLDCDSGGVTNIDECTSSTDPFDSTDDCQAAIDLNLNICALINFDPNHPLASLDCDNGGVINIVECQTGEDPADPADDCKAAAEGGLDICAIIAGGHPWASLDCDNGGISNEIECNNGGDPNDPQDDLHCPSDLCEEAAANNLDICTILASDPTDPLASLDCDNGGIINIIECNNGGDPNDPADDCTIAELADADICTMITADPDHPLADLDCDNGGLINSSECTNGGDPFDPADDCDTAINAAMDLCLIIGADPNHPLAQLDCDNGGVTNYIECSNGGDPTDPGDDCETAIVAEMDLCAIINGDASHPWASLDCDNGGVINITECNSGLDPSEPLDDVPCEPCTEAENNGVDICVVLADYPNHPLGNLDCDNGGIDNVTECNNGGDPFNANDDCDIAEQANINICLLIYADTDNPLASQDCDNGGVTNIEECQSGEDPFDPADDCDTAIDEGLPICVMVGSDPNHPLASGDCDNGGVDNYTECTNGGDPADPADDCQVAIDADVDICAVIGGDPTHPWANLDCDNGGIINITECNSGENPSDPADDCQTVMDENIDLCALINADPSHPLATADCDNGGAMNIKECYHGQDPLDPSDDCQTIMDAEMDICLIILTDPSHPLSTQDCDNGGIINIIECNTGGDPTVASDDVYCDGNDNPCNDLTGSEDICAMLAADPTSPLGTADCDNGGVDNATECANNGNPWDDNDDCDMAIAGSVDICMLIFGNPNHPLASQDCDNGGVPNYEECITGEDPSDPLDDCTAALENDSIDLCDILILPDGTYHAMASLDCDNGGVPNINECLYGYNPEDASDECEAAIGCGLDICVLIDGDPNHPLADLDCDNGGIPNYMECMNGGDPHVKSDDCTVAIDNDIDVCTLICGDMDHPLATLDCDDGGMPNHVECTAGSDPNDPTDDCIAVVETGVDICTMIAIDPTTPFLNQDCDNGGIDNQTECANGGNPSDPADDCMIAIAIGEDICAIINGDPSHPLATEDCDNGGVDNFTECANATNPGEASDDCTAAKAGGLDVCQLIGYDPGHPLATLDCDNGGVDNYTECRNSGDPCDPNDDCGAAVQAGMDLCVIINSDPAHPWASMDCDRGGVENLAECLAGNDPSDPIDDQNCPVDLCTEASDNNVDICAILVSDPSNPIGTLDCDGGGVMNSVECANSGDPFAASDDCMIAETAQLDICTMIASNPAHPLASADCDGGGVMNAVECASGENPFDATDDCTAAIDEGINICQLINFNPAHPMASLDCDNGGVDNITECNSGSNPSVATDDVSNLCITAMDGNSDICAMLTADPTHPIGQADCDGGGVSNTEECQNGNDPTDNLDDCPDLTPITTILPGNIAGISGVGIAIEVTELNGIATNGSSIIVRIPSDPRLTFTWDQTLTNVALTSVNNANWTYLGNNGVVHTFQYSKPGLIINGRTTEAFGFQSSYDPQATDGQTTITATIIPFSGGECNVLNNTDSERLVYFE